VPWEFGTALRYIPGENGKLIISTLIIPKVSLAAGNHSGVSTASLPPAVVMDSTAEIAAAPRRCKVGGEHRSKHPGGRFKQSFS
jgi:hypothetical protein